METNGLRKVVALVGAYALTSVATVGVIVALRSHHDEVTATAWVRGVIVGAVSLVSLALAVAAAHGNRGAWLRLRIVSAIMLVAIAAFLAIPGSLPTWMKLEQAVCGVLLLGVAAIVNGPRARASFSAVRH